MEQTEYFDGLKQNKVSKLHLLKVKPLEKEFIDFQIMISTKENLRKGTLKTKDSTSRLAHY